MPSSFTSPTAWFGGGADASARAWPVRNGPVPFRSRRTISLFLAVWLGACGSLPRQAYAPGDEGLVSVEGFSNVRIWADASPRELAAHSKSLGPAANPGSKPVSLLALSGGGSAAAYGAGLLSGWTERGDRPSFDVVTGVSAGALLAPFAFLGPTYDHAMMAAFDPTTTKSLGSGITPFRALFGTSISNNMALTNLIDRSITQQLMQDVALENGKGRRLLILTTDLDSQRPVVWDLGAIAATGRPDALNLFRRVLLASASVPGIYPSVRFDVKTPTSRYQELHADGGIFEQIFVGPEAVLIGAMPSVLPKTGQVDLYLIINNSLDPEFEVTKDSILGVVGRSYETIIKSHAISTVNTAFLFSQRNGLRFHLAYIREAVPYDYRHPFARVYVDKLLSMGRQNGFDADWLRRPPIGVQDRALH